MRRLFSLLSLFSIGGANLWFLLTNSYPEGAFTWVVLWVHLFCALLSVFICLMILFVFPLPARLEKRELPPPKKVHPLVRRTNQVVSAILFSIMIAFIGTIGLGIISWEIIVPAVTGLPAPEIRFSPEEGY